MVARFSDAFFAVFYGFRRAIAYASHAMRAVFSPFRFAVIKGDIVHRAIFYALSAPDTSIFRSEGFRFYDKAVKYRVYGSAHKAVVKVISRFLERFARFNP